MDQSGPKWTKIDLLGPFYRKLFAVSTIERAGVVIVVVEFHNVGYSIDGSAIIGGLTLAIDKGRIVLLDTAKNFAKADLPLAKSYLETIRFSAGLSRSFVL